MADIQVSGLNSDGNSGKKTDPKADFITKSVAAAQGSGQSTQTKGATPADQKAGGAKTSRKDEDSTFLQALEKFDIPESARTKHRELIELILVTKSMDDEERQYWFHIMPIMTSDQVEKLRKILLNEQQKLAELNRDYNERVFKLNQEYMLKWQEQESERKRIELDEAEEAAEQEDAQAEAALLEQLDSLE